MVNSLKALGVRPVERILHEVRAFCEGEESRDDMRVMVLRVPEP